MRRAYNSPPEAKSKKSVNSSGSCRMCGGTGWRLFMIDAYGDRRVTRCECRRPLPLPSSEMPDRVAIPDYKSAAAGER